MDYIQREMYHSQGGFYSAQDADSEGVEGKYYVFDYDEVIKALGAKEGSEFNKYFNITAQGNFEGKNIPNLIKNDSLDDSFDAYLPKLYEYRKSRTLLHLDDKILTSWNSLMISAFANAFRILKDSRYHNVMKKSFDFIENNLFEGDSLLVSWRDGFKTKKGFLDDYAFYIYALINAFDATDNHDYISRANVLAEKTITDFFDNESGGFYLYGKENDRLILQPKETYDGAMPSGNSVMTYNLIRLARHFDDEKLKAVAKKQLEFMSSSDYPAGNSFFLSALILHQNPPEKVVCDDYSCKLVKSDF